MALNPHYSPEHKLLFYPILKVGSSAWRIELDAHGFSRYQGFNAAEDLPSYTAFAVVRQPGPRYLSAVAQMYRSYVQTQHGTKWDDFITAVALINRATGEPWRNNADPHFDRQADSIAEMPANRRLFKLGDNSLNVWLLAYGIRVAPAGNPTPVEQTYALGKIIDPAPIRTWYRADYRLLTEVTEVAVAHRKD